MNFLGRIKSELNKITVLRSLRFRLFIIIMAVGILCCLVMRFGIMQSYFNRALEVRTLDVQNQIKILADHLITYDYLQDQRSEVVNAELNMLSNLYDGRVLIINNSFKVIKDTYNVSQGKTIISEEIVRSFKGESIAKYDAKNGYIEITTPIIDNINTEGSESATQVLADGSANQKIKGVMLTSVSTDYITVTMDILSRKAIIVEAIMITIVFALALIFSRALTKPFGRVTKAINEVQAGYSNEPISVPDLAETEHIVDAFNQVLHRMKVLDESREEFVSNVSHELRTPLTSMKVLSDSLLMQEDVPNELYKEFMQDIASEIDRENKIITDLLTLVRLDKTSGDLDVTSVSVNETIELILKRLRPIARKQDVEVIFESNRSVVAEIDEVKITLALTNLVENAIKHGISLKENGGTVTLKTERVDNDILISIIDDGIGFDVDKQLDDGRTHIGLPNVKHRLSYFIDSEFNVESSSLGTTIKILLKNIKKEKK